MTMLACAITQIGYALSDGIEGLAGNRGIGRIVMMSTELSAELFIFPKSDCNASPANSC
jgi:hypothetical protein